MEIPWVIVHFSKLRPSDLSNYRTVGPIAIMAEKQDHDRPFLCLDHQWYLHLYGLCSITTPMARGLWYRQGFRNVSV